MRWRGSQRLLHIGLTIDRFDVTSCASQSRFSGDGFFGSMCINIHMFIIRRVRRFRRGLWGTTTRDSFDLHDIIAFQRSFNVHFIMMFRR